MDNIPPDDSIFSMPIWNKNSDPSASGVQMNPATAMQQGQVKSAIRSIIRGVSVAVVVLAVIGGGVAYLLTIPGSATQASIDLKHAVIGTVGLVKYAENTFALTNTKSEDPTIIKTGITNWTVQLPPGASLTKDATTTLSTCHTISSLERNLTEAVPVSCVNFVKEGDKAVIEYLIVQAETSTIITSKIIREE